MNYQSLAPRHSSLPRCTGFRQDNEIGYFVNASDSCGYTQVLSFMPSFALLLCIACTRVRNYYYYHASQYAISSIRHYHDFAIFVNV